jgi:iron-sulfur cluster assembly accessory protein
MSDHTLILTERAEKRIQSILSAEAEGTELRLSVDGGGCSGFQYKFDLSSERFSDDLLISRNGVTLRVDPVSLPLLEGSEVDFVDDLMGQSFRVTNPNATASCGCGTSFSL